MIERALVFLQNHEKGAETVQLVVQLASLQLRNEIQTALIRGVVKFNVASDLLPYLCPTRLVGLATPLIRDYKDNSCVVLIFSVKFPPYCSIHCMHSLKISDPITPFEFTTKKGSSEIPDLAMHYFIYCMQQLYLLDPYNVKLLEASFL